MSANVTQIETRVSSSHLPQLTNTEQAPTRKPLILALLVITLAALSLLIHYLTPIAWDIAATRFLQSIKAPGLTELMRIISGFGNGPKVVAIAAIALLACNKGREAICLTWSGLGGWFVSIQLKGVFAEPRPTSDVVAVFHQWPDGSFPSGHLAFYVCFFGFLFYLARQGLPRRSLVRSGILILTAGLTLTVGLSRVYLGEHWISDVPGSYLFGALWLALSIKLYRWLPLVSRHQKLRGRLG